MIERDGGYVETQPVRQYFAGYRRWPLLERELLRAARGRVLDIGCGAGRAALELDARGREVVAVDSSPGAVAVCKARGLRDVRQRTLRELDAQELGRFQTLLLLGCNFALLETRAQARKHLRRLGPLLSDDGRLLAELLDPYRTESPDHLAYHKRNAARGASGGELRVRFRYRRASSGWQRLLFVSLAELTEIAAYAAWRVDLLGEQEPLYTVALTPER